MTSEQIIAGRYHLQDRIGSGGMGTVYKSIDTETGNIVAVKALNPEAVLSRPDSVERFRREGQALRELNHPNIVKVFDTIEEDGNQYLVQEYLGGGDLKSRILDGPLSIKEVLTIALDLADALTRAHHLNIIHRDLKPANILLDDDGKPHLSDFGIALIADMERVTKKGAAIGTADYMSPEMLRAEEVDVRTDVWSFGVTLFEMITGQRPFAAKSLGQLIAQIMHAPHPDLESIRLDVPVDLVDLVYRMLEKDRNVRLASARLIGAEVETILRGRSTDPLDSNLRIMIDAQRFEVEPDAMYKTNLPTPPTPFVGREEELTHLQSLVINPDVRLVTILAPGGMGKTRLALEVARQQRVTFRDGVFWTGLAPIDDPIAIAGEITQAIGFASNQSKGDAKHQLFDYLHDKHLLLLLDNFEHLIDAAGIVTEILENAPHVTVLVTSRQRLSQSSETVFNLEGMEMPDWDDPVAALNSSMVQLFLQGANRAQAGYTILPKDVPEIARICQQLQGMPLGILLAASWVELLSLAEIANEMQSNLDFLETDLEDIPERQRSLRAVFDYSWNLLSADEQSTYMKLAVFRGGFTRQAAQQITGANLRILMGLINKSLIRRNPESGRYWVHELLRQYAAVKLAQSGERNETLNAYANYFTDMMHQLEPDLNGSKMQEALRIIDADDENFATAWLYWVRHPDWQRMYEMVFAFGRYASLRNRFEERNSLLQLAVNIVDNYPLEHVFQPIAKALSAVYIVSGEVDYVLDCLKDIESIGTAYDIAYGQWLTGNIYKINNDHETAITYFEKARKTFADEAAAFDEANVLQGISQSLLALGKDEEAIKTIEACLELRREIRDKQGQSTVLIQLGAIHMVKANYDKAESYWQRARDLTVEVMGDVQLVPEINISLALIAFLHGNIDEAKTLVQTMYEATTVSTMADYQSFALAILAVIAVVQNDLKTAQAHITAMDTLPVGEFDYWIEADKYWARALVAIASDDVATARRWCRDALQVGLDSKGTLMIWSLPIAAMIAAHEGRNERAVMLMGIAMQHKTSVPQWLKKWNAFQKQHAELKEKLGTIYDLLWQSATSADLTTVVSVELQHLSDSIN